jgi:hypothetical protein
MSRSSRSQALSHEKDKTTHHLIAEVPRTALDEPRLTKYLTDRLFGKAPQSLALEHSGAANFGLAEQIKKARERVAQSRSRQ